MTPPGEAHLTFSWSFLGNSEKGDSSSSEDVEDESEEIDDDLTPPLLD